VLSVKIVYSAEEANALLTSGKWRLIDARIVQQSSFVDGKAAQGAAIVFVLACVKP
jgi:hypothetical protein